eukprot:756254-Hanusia_phi.AAC.1
MKIAYMNIQSEALPDSLPKGQNNPQRCPRGLYAEQLSGSSFTMPRSKNLRTWLYRILPSVDDGEFVEDDEGIFKNVAKSYDSFDGNPNQLRWNPFPFVHADQRITFLQGLWSIAGAGDPSAKKGVAIYLYACNISMTDAFYNSDGEASKQFSSDWNAESDV